MFLDLKERHDQRGTLTPFLEVCEIVLQEWFHSPQCMANSEQIGFCPGVFKVSKSMLYACIGW